MFIFTINVKAFENNVIKFEIPEGYEQKVNEKEVFKWIKDNNYIAISYSSNIKTKYNIKYFSEDEIKKQKEIIESKLNTGLEKYNIKAEISDINRYNDNDLYYLEYNVYYPSKNVVGYNIYQRGRMYTTNKYIVTTIFNSDKEIKDEDYNNLFKSFKIKDTHTVNKRVSGLKVLILTIILGSILSIIKAILDNKRRK